MYRNHFPWMFLTLSYYSFSLKTSNLAGRDRYGGKDMVELENSAADFGLWIKDSKRDIPQPLVNYQQAAGDILEFAGKAAQFLRADVSRYDSQGLKKYSFKLIKKLRHLDKFPAFVRGIIGNVSHYSDIRFLENAVDIFSIFEMKRLSAYRKVYDALHDLYLKPCLEGRCSSFGVRSLLYAFTKHTLKKKRELQDFIKFFVHASEDNIYIPSRYQKGSLLGLDAFMTTLNVTSSLMQEINSIYCFAPSSVSRNVCVAEQIHFATSRSFLHIEQHKDYTNCLRFRFEYVETSGDYILSTVEEYKRYLRIRPSPFNDVELVRNYTKLEVVPSFRLVGLPAASEPSTDGSVLIVQRSRDSLFFLSHSTKKVRRGSKYLSQLSQWDLIDAENLI